MIFEATYMTDNGVGDPIREVVKRVDVSYCCGSYDDCFLVAVKQALAMADGYEGLVKVEIIAS